MTLDLTKVDYAKPPVTGTITTNGIVLENQPIGRVTFKCKGWSIKNCPAVGLTLPSSGDAAVITCSDPVCEDGWLEDVDVTAQTPNVRWARGVIGHHFTAVRTVCHGLVDGWGWYHPTGGTMHVVQTDCGAHDLTWFAVDPNHSDGTHNDAIQAHSALLDVTLTGGLYDAGPKGTASLMANVAKVDSLWVSKTQLLGGRSSVNLSTSPTTRVGIRDSVLAGPIYATGGVTTRRNVRPDGSDGNKVSKP